MLYDTRWDRVTDPMTTEALVAWLERQPAHKEYSYHCTGICLLAQYFGHVHSARVLVGPNNYNVLRSDGFYDIDIRLPEGWNNIARDRPHIFGAALERARALLTER
jgi:hypothetical protein